MNIGELKNKYLETIKDNLSNSDLIEDALLFGYKCGQSVLWHNQDQARLNHLVKRSFYTTKILQLPYRRRCYINRRGFQKRYNRFLWYLLLSPSKNQEKIRRSPDIHN